MVKNPPAVQEIRFPSLGREDAVEKGMATHPVFLLENPMGREAWRVQSMGSHRLGHESSGLPAGGRHGCHRRRSGLQLAQVV